MNDNKERIEVKNLFQTQYNISLTDIPISNEQPSPDFEYCLDNKRIFVMELKTLELVVPSKKTKFHKSDYGFWQKIDKSPSKLAHLIKDAQKQLTQYIEPKILTFLSTSSLDFTDLTTTLSGKTTYHNQNNLDEKITFNNYEYITKSNLKYIKNIDLYIWINICIFLFIHMYLHTIISLIINNHT